MGPGRLRGHTARNSERHEEGEHERDRQSYCTIDFPRFFWLRCSPVPYAHFDDLPYALSNFLSQSLLRKLSYCGAGSFSFADIPFFMLLSCATLARMVENGGNGAHGSRKPFREKRAAYLPDGYVLHHSETGAGRILRRPDGSEIGLFAEDEMDRAERAAFDDVEKRRRKKSDQGS